MKRRAFLLAAAMVMPLASADTVLDVPSPKPAFHGEGMLNRVDPGIGIINISHGPVPAAGWQTMTRDLRLKPKNLARGLVPGMRVRFRLQAVDRLNYHVVAIEPVK